MKKILTLKSLLLLTAFSTLIINCSPPSGGKGGSSDSSPSNSVFGANEIILVFGLLLIVAIFTAFGKGRKNPRLAAYIFLGLGLISLIIGFKFKEWGMEISRRADAMYGAEEGVAKGEMIVFLIAIVFLILGGYYLYKSSPKKG